VKARRSAYALRLPASIKAEAEKIAREDGASFNPFVASAVAKKVAAIRTLNYFAPFRARANLDEFDRIMQPKTGAPPQPGDEFHRVGGSLGLRLTITPLSTREAAMRRSRTISLTGNHR
jgi:hypothetical protein